MIRTGVRVTVYTSNGYRYNIDPNEYIIEYDEDNRTIKDQLSFGSKEEMKAVAEGILKALEFVNESSDTR